MDNNPAHTSGSAPHMANIADSEGPSSSVASAAEIHFEAPGLDLDGTIDEPPTKIQATITG